MSDLSEELANLIAEMRIAARLLRENGFKSTSGRLVASANKAAHALRVHASKDPQ